MERRAHPQGRTLAHGCLASHKPVTPATGRAPAWRACPPEAQSCRRKRSVGTNGSSPSFCSVRIPSPLQQPTHFSKVEDSIQAHNSCSQIKASYGHSSCIAAQVQGHLGAARALTWHLPPACPGCFSAGQTPPPRAGPLRRRAQESSQRVVSSPAVALRCNDVAFRCSWCAIFGVHASGPTAVRRHIALWSHLLPYLDPVCCP